jgi:hypothetical protein
MKRSALAAVVISVAACTTSGDGVETTTPQTLVAPTTTTLAEVPTTSTGTPIMDVTSEAFTPGEVIPTEFTCDGANISPPLSISDLSSETGSLVLIMDDPDAPVGVWDHWVEYDIPITGSGMEITADAGPLGVQGINSWNLPGYGGPCPPEGETHTYFMRVYAIDGMLGLPAGVDSEVVRDAMSGRTLVEIQLTGQYSR